MLKRSNLFKNHTKQSFTMKTSNPEKLLGLFLCMSTMVRKSFVTRQAQRSEKQNTRIPYRDQLYAPVLDLQCRTKQLSCKEKISHGKISFKDL